MVRMCPDREILSVYLDGELPSPWKEKLESHLGGCVRCRERLEAYRAVRRMVLDRPAAGAMEAAKERVRAGLEKRMGAAPRYRSAGVWRRHIAVPLPVAAAAAAVFVIVLALVWMRRPAVYLPESETMASEIDVRGIVPISDMDGVLQYLSGEDTGNYVILKLPESRNFTSTGEPMILKEADYRSSRQSVPVREPWRKPSR